MKYLLYLIIRNNGIELNFKNFYNKKYENGFMKFIMCMFWLVDERICN